jgi:hypothetical protein
MVIPKQYPYELFKHTQGGDSVQDPITGDWVPNPGMWEKVGMCRDEVNSKGSYITVSDGSAHVFDFLIQLPRATPFIHVGTKIQVRSGSIVRVEGEVKRFDPSQMHCRIWI